MAINQRLIADLTFAISAGVGFLGIYAWWLWPVSFQVVPNWLLVWPILVCPVVEEIVFRGALQDFIQCQLKGKVLLPRISCANAYTSLAFALFHMVGHSFFWAVVVLFPSLVFGYFKDEHKKLVYPIGLHMHL